ncbi:hypothetical protein EUGRSUZ_D00735, partial [Eucalyptus grandis]
MSRRPSYEVFLSFRGPDTRKDFVDCLCTSLTDAGICVFMDEEELESGEEIHAQLIQAIRESKISIPVISKEYGSSKSCLMELEEMLKCKHNGSHIIIPIFYYVDPSDVRNCRGSFGRSLQGHKRNIDGKVIDYWKSALRRIGWLKGHHLGKTSKVSRHGKLIKQIVHQVLEKLKKKDLIVPKNLVGVDSYVQNIMAKLKVDYRNGQAVNIAPTRDIVLIHGIAGVGKTALAKHVYNQIHHLFDACSFLGPIRAEMKHHDVLFLQKKLISDVHKGNVQKFYCSDNALTHIQNRFLTMKILLLLDDVEDHEQLIAIVGELDWLGPGSRVILTSQRQDFLKYINGAVSFVLEPMVQHVALKLFCWHAFRSDSPLEEFKQRSTDIVAATGRLPLALELVGSSLFQEKSDGVWKDTLNALKVDPHKRVEAALEKSFTSLDWNEQQIFLDIACFFIGKDKRIPSYMWENCEYSPSTSIRALHARSFVEIGEDKELCMHEILKNFGQKKVKNENRNEPCKRSRLCIHEDALNVLKNSKGTKKVKALGLEFGDGSKENIRYLQKKEKKRENIRFGCDHFKGLKNLRFLKLDQADIQGNFGDCLSSLSWLDWRGCPKSFDERLLDLNLQNLVILDLSGSQVEEDWGGWGLLKRAIQLKVLKLTGCVQLMATPKFPALMELERLILEGCSKLAVIHRSFRNLKKLISLNMKGCSFLNELPDLDGSDIHKLSEFIESLKELKTLSLKNCRGLSYLPDGIGKLRSLQSLDLSHTGIQKLPPSVKDLKAMTVLTMRDTFIHEFPKAILNLEKLEEIDLSSCQKLEGKINCEIGTLSSLAILKLSDTRISSLPRCIFRLSCLRELHILGCSNLESPLTLPPS